MLIGMDCELDLGREDVKDEGELAAFVHLRDSSLSCVYTTPPSALTGQIWGSEVSTTPSESILGTEYELPVPLGPCRRRPRSECSVLDYIKGTLRPLGCNEILLTWLGVLITCRATNVSCMSLRCRRMEPRKRWRRMGSSRA